MIREGSHVLFKKYQCCVLTVCCVDWILLTVTRLYLFSLSLSCSGSSLTHFWDASPKQRRRSIEPGKWKPRDQESCEIYSEFVEFRSVEIGKEMVAGASGVSHVRLSPHLTKLHTKSPLNSHLSGERINLKRPCRLLLLICVYTVISLFNLYLSRHWAREKVPCEKRGGFNDDPK
jgi:hypothetical protein